MKNTADVVVIGGGVMGIAIGCELALRGDLPGVVKSSW